MNSFLKHARFQTPLAIMRNRVSQIWRMAYFAGGRYKPLAAAETKTVRQSPVPFKGDIPVGAGDQHSQTRLRFASPRPVFEEVENLIVTPAGAGWKDGVLYEKYSASKPGLRILSGGRQPVRTVPAGFFVQSEHTDTFGDWTAEYLAPLARVGALDKPVFLPTALSAKPYVKRDARRLGVEFIAIEAPMLIKKAMVIRQPKVIRYWAQDDVRALKKLLGTNAPDPSPNSLVYLSRYKERSEIAVRSHPNLAIESVVKSRGGLVLRTGETDLREYLAVAKSAETMLFDHGSAGYNMIYWRPRRVIEFVSDDWWVNGFLMFADASGICDYTIIRSDLGGPDAVASKVEAALDQPILS